MIKLIEVKIYLASGEVEEEDDTDEQESKKDNDGSRDEEVNLRAFVLSMFSYFMEWAHLTIIPVECCTQACKKRFPPCNDQVTSLTSLA